jgi:DNA polymerase
LKKLIIEALKDQKDIFGDELFDIINFAKYSPSSEKNKSKQTIHIEREQNISLFKEDFENTNNLKELYDQIHECKKCSLGDTRTNFVFGVGNPDADLMLIGEAPGRDEDLKGEPFVGRAGKLLNDILKAIKFKRDDVYIANILKCRPPNNRDPLPEEADLCRPYLNKQINLIKPKIILCLGRVAAVVLLNKKVSLSQLRGSVHEYEGVRLMATYHPAALLRNPNWKKGCWEDVQKVRELYDELKGI